MEECESPKQRHDRELIELLNELRVALPGVQVGVVFAALWYGLALRAWVTER